MKPASPDTRAGAPQFTAGEHLRVQFQIEVRAREIWVRGGSRQNASLDNWLQAEREVTERFIRARSNGGDRQPESRFEAPNPRRNRIKQHRTTNE